MCPTSNLHRGACLSWPGGPLQRVHQRIAHIAQPLSKYLAREGASRKSEQVSLTEGAMKAFETLKQACMTATILAFADYTKPFLLDTNTSKEGLGAVLSQKQAERQYHPIAFGSRALMSHERTITWSKLCSWHWNGSYRAIQGIHLFQSFVVQMDNNPLMYIMSTPNLDAMGHWSVGTLHDSTLNWSIKKDMIKWWQMYLAE